jgi:hypothetical protein
MSQVEIVEAPAGVRSQAASIPPGTRQTGAFGGINTFQSLHTLLDTAKVGRRRLHRWRGGIHVRRVMSCSDDDASRRDG